MPAILIERVKYTSENHGAFAISAESLLEYLSEYKL